MTSRLGPLVPWALAAGLAAFVALTANDYILTVAVVTAITGILAIGLNLIMGYSGLINLGIGAFYALGAYGAAKFSVAGSLPAGVVLVVMPLIAFVVGLVVGLPILRTRGLHFAVATLGLGLIVTDVLNNWIAVTNGPLGVGGIKRPDGLGILDLTQNDDYFVFCALILAVVMALAALFHRSRLARVLVATRDDELLTRSLGFEVNPYKLVAFALSGAAAALAGVLYAWFILFISPPPFTFFAASFPVFVLVAVGGPGTLWGPLVGAIFLNGLPEAFEVEARTQLILYGAVLLATVVFLPKGLAPEVSAWLRRLATRARGHRPGPPGPPQADPPAPGASSEFDTHIKGVLR